MVLSTLALMMCGTRERLERVCGALVRALADGGRLLVVVTHPCFRQADYGTFRYDLPEGFRYWDSGAAYDVVLTPAGTGDRTVITDHHWTLADYVAALAAVGGRITAMRELPAARGEDGSPTGPPAYLAVLVERPGE